MTTGEALSCPYCNAVVPADAAAPSGRVVCPRCGETFAGRPPTTAVTAAPPAPRPAAPSPGAPPLLQAAPPNWPFRLAALSLVVLVICSLLRVVLADYPPARIGYPFMVGVACLGLLAAVWLWYFRTRRSNQAVVLFVLGNMLFMAGVALPFALLTTDSRRQHDPKNLPDDKEPPPATVGRRVAPGQLPALGYLPRDTNLVAGLHVRELLQEKGGREFLEQGGWSPAREMDVLKMTRGWTGLPPEAIDHVVAGSRPGQALLPKFNVPQLFIVVQTREPYDLKGFSKEVTSGRKDQLHQRPLYYFQPNKMQGFLWCPTDRTFVVGVLPDLANAGEVEALLRAVLPARPHAGAEALPGRLRACLQQRVGRGTLLWVAGQDVPTFLLRPLVPFDKENKGRGLGLDKIQTFHLGLRFRHEDVALAAEFQCTDAGAALRLERFLKDMKLEGLEAPRVAGALPALTWAPAFAWGPAPLATAAALVAGRTHQERQARDAAENWVSVQVRGNPADLRKALKR
jgi:hypothetical protein